MVFEHDCEYVDGVIEERDLGEFEHAFVQGILTTLFKEPCGVGRIRSSRAAGADAEDAFPRA